MPLSVRKVPSDSGTALFAASVPARARAGIMMPNRPMQHVDAADDVVEGGIAGEPSEGRAVVVALRGQGVEDLGEPVGAGVERAGTARHGSTRRWRSG